MAREDAVHFADDDAIRAEIERIRKRLSELYRDTARNVLCQNAGSSAYGEAMVEVIDLEGKLQQYKSMLQDA
ncbi:MAG: hypothetical protein E7328_07255 [Clostridiales bacterium]|nr:hypothetical protein [Clostridiales bacterium]